jgi:putative intracellular protease/amidase
MIDLRLPGALTKEYIMSNDDIARWDEKAETHRRVLMVLTSHTTLGGTGQSTGWYLPEAAHPWHEFRQAGIEMDWASPIGGLTLPYGADLNDAAQAAFVDEFGESGPVTLAASSLDPARYDAIFYVGGHGTMWDFPDNTPLATAAATIYSDGGVVAAVCHGPAGLVNITLPTGEPLVAGRQVAAFTNDEEVAVGLADTVPFLLADALTAKGATHTFAANFEPHVVVDGRLITGQNPASATGVAVAVVTALASLADLIQRVRTARSPG